MLAPPGRNSEGRGAAGTHLLLQPQLFLLDLLLQDLAELLHVLVVLGHTPVVTAGPGRG